MAAEPMDVIWILVVSVIAAFIMTIARQSKVAGTKESLPPGRYRVLQQDTAPEGGYTLVVQRETRIVRGWQSFLHPAHQLPRLEQELGSSEQEVFTVESPEKVPEVFTIE